MQNVEKQPMFCLETAVKLLTFSWAVYGNESSCPAKELIGVSPVPSARSKALQEAHSGLVGGAISLKSDAGACAVERGSSLEKQYAREFKVSDSASSSHASSSGTNQVCCMYTLSNFKGCHAPAALCYCQCVCCLETTGLALLQLEEICRYIRNNRSISCLVAVCIGGNEDYIPCCKSYD